MAANKHVEKTARAGIAEQNHAFEVAVARSNAAAIGKLYANDAVIVPPDGRPARGRTAITKYFRKAIKGVKKITLRSTRIQANEKFAVETGRFKLVFKKVRINGKWKESTLHGTSLVVWLRKGATWYFLCDAWK